MRQLDGVGCEWGIEWVMRHLLEEDVTPFDTEEAFEESLRGCEPPPARSRLMRQHMQRVVNESG
jgi:hypothetical protein